jgi:BirA family biotin operon repressor/biotin-[acetyl-CoA-carboxylase] ligase
VAWLVLGIGINLNVDRAEFPAEFRHLATSLASYTGRRIDRVAFTRRLYNGLERTLDRCAASGFASIRPAFEAYFRMAGRPVVVVGLGGEETRGRALGIDEGGALRIEREDGAVVRVVAGDVTVAKEAP